MKYFREVLISSAVLAFTSNIYASTQESVNCPSISIVKNAIFIQAKYKHLIGWDMISNNFNYQGKQWRTMFGTAILDEDISASEAIHQGQTIFNSLPLHNPTERVKDKITICIYLFTDQNLVATTTPPVDLEISEK